MINEAYGKAKLLRICNKMITIRKDTDIKQALEAITANKVFLKLENMSDQDIVIPQSSIHIIEIIGDFNTLSFKEGSNKLHTLILSKSSKGCADLSNTFIDGINMNECTRDGDFIKPYSQLRDFRVSGGYIKNLTLEGGDNIEYLVMDIDSEQLLSRVCGMKLKKLRCSTLTSFPKLQYPECLLSLDLSSKLLTNLRGLNKCINLGALWIEGADISNIEEIKDLTKILSLNIGHTKIKSLHHLKHLVNLKSLNLNYLSISSLEEIYHLADITSLYIVGTLVLDLSFVDKLVNITLLNMSNTLITDLSRLSLLPLKKLYASRQPADWNIIKDIYTLTHVSLTQCEIDNADMFADHPSLHTVILHNNNIDDLKPFTRCPKLKYLDVSNNRVVDPSVLSSTDFDMLNLIGNPIAHTGLLSNIKAKKLLIPPRLAGIMDDTDKEVKRVVTKIMDEVEPTPFIQLVDHLSPLSGLWMIRYCRYDNIFVDTLFRDLFERAITLVLKHEAKDTILSIFDRDMLLCVESVFYNTVYTIASFHEEYRLNLSEQNLMALVDRKPLSVTDAVTSYINDRMSEQW